MICQQLHGIRMGAVVAAVAGCAAHHRPGSDGLDLFCRNTVPLAVVAHFEQVRRQQLRVDLAAGGGKIRVSDANDKNFVFFGKDTLQQNADAPNKLNLATKNGDVEVEFVR